MSPPPPIGNVHHNKDHNDLSCDLYLHFNNITHGTQISTEKLSALSVIAASVLHCCRATRRSLPDMKPKPGFNIQVSATAKGHNLWFASAANKKEKREENKVGARRSTVCVCLEWTQHRWVGRIGSLRTYRGKWRGRRGRLIWKLSVIVFHPH